MQVCTPYVWCDWITEYHKSEHASQLYDVLMRGVTWRILFSIFTISAQTVAIDL